MKRYLVMLIAIFAFGCSKADVMNYQGAQPRLDLFAYFQGQTSGWGMVQDRKGMVIRQFVVRITGERISSTTLVLDEYFDWRDGEKSRRTWTIERTGTNTFKGSAGDVVGDAVGASYGNALNWKYFLNIEVGKKTRKIHLNDWMYLQPDNILINKTAMSKFGIHVGDITIVFRKIKSSGQG